MKLRGLIFDCDGTLADSMPLLWCAWEEVTTRHGVEFTRERFYALGGVPGRTVARMLVEEQGVAVDPQVLARDKDEAYWKLIPQVQPVNAVIDVARAYHKKLPMAVASGGKQETIFKVLDHLDIRDLFDEIVTSESVAHQKPAPDIFLEAARRLNIPPATCRAYEDSMLGLQAIRAAGMQAVDVRQLLELRV